MSDQTPTFHIREATAADFPQIFHIWLEGQTQALGAEVPREHIDSMRSYWARTTLSRSSSFGPAGWTYRGTIPNAMMMGVWYYVPGARAAL